MKDMKKEELKAVELNDEELDKVTGGVYSGACFQFKVAQGGVQPVLAQTEGVPAAGPEVNK